MANQMHGYNAVNNFAIDHILLIQGELGLDLSGSFYSLSIEESMDSGMMSGELSMIDSYGLTNGLGMRGDELVDISFKSTLIDGSESEQFVKRFRVTRYNTNDNPDALNKKFVILSLVSEAEGKNEFIKISKSYNQVGAHQIVQELLETLGYDKEKINVESTLYNRDIVIPNLSPLRAISYLATFCQSGESASKGDSNFYFFENRNGVNFVSGSSLTQKDPVAKLTYAGTSEHLMFNKILKYSRVRGYNIQDQARNGGLGAMVHSYSLVNKNYRSFYMDNDHAKEIYPKLNAEKWYGGDLEPTRQSYVEFRSEDQMYKFLNMGSNGNAAAIRAINKTGLQSKRALCTVPGNTNLTTGDIVTVQVAVEDDNAGTSDSGNWMISKIKHQISKGTYIMHMELVSDSDVRRL